MRSFNLEEFKAGAVGITRDGRSAVYKGPAGGRFVALAVVGGQHTYSYTADGFYWDSLTLSEFDIVGLQDVPEAPKEDPRRYELAKEFAVAMIGKRPVGSVPTGQYCPTYGEVARGALRYADALLEALNEPKA